MPRNLSPQQSNDTMVQQQFIRQRSAPTLAMIVDRTSFDETDNYGVNVDALQQSWTESSDSVILEQKRVLKNGKVRRRLRWRPRKVPPEDQRITITPSRKSPILLNRNDSSNLPCSASVNSNSNASQNSKQSRKSVHSFASIETIKKNNTINSQHQQQPFPLPRPNYNDKFAIATDDSPVTIGNEGEYVHARMQQQQSPDIDNGGTIFAPADATDFSPELVTPQVGNRSRGTPPLFKRKPVQQQSPQILQTPVPAASSSASSTAYRTPPRATPPRPTKSNSSSFYTPPQSSASQSTNNTSQRSSAVNSSGSNSSLSMRPLAESIPSLSSEDFESERRVDLRIPVDGASTTGASINNDNASRSDNNSASVYSTPTRNRQVLSVEDLRPANKNSPGIPSELVIEHQANENSPMVILDSASSEDTDDDDDYHSVTTEPESVKKSSPYHTHDKNNYIGTPMPKPLSDRIIPSKKSSTSSSSTPPPANKQPQTLRSKLSRMSQTSKDTNASRTSSNGPSSPARSEMRFRMMERRKDIESTPIVNDEDRTPPSPHKTGPVDLDDGTFLEAEKNLHAIHAMATEHLKHGEYSEALEVFEEILRGQLARYGPHHFRVGTALHNIGIVQMKRGDYNKAIKVCREAVNVRKQALGPAHPDVAVSLAQLGVVYLEMKRHKKAIVAFREALRIRRHCLGPSHPKVAKILNNIGCALYELNELEVAKIAFEEALDVQRENLRDIPGDEEDVSAQQLLSVASTLCNIGSIKLYWGQYEDASVDLEDALLLQQSVLGDTHPIAKRTEESLEWIEATKRAANGNMSPLAEGILLTLSGLSTRSKRDESLTCASTPGILNVLEQKVMDWQEKLDFQCGGALSPRRQQQEEELKTAVSI